jgi:hypothetical protein
LFIVGVIQTVMTCAPAEQEVKGYGLHKKFRVFPSAELFCFATTGMDRPLASMTNANPRRRDSGGNIW